MFLWNIVLCYIAEDHSRRCDIVKSNSVLCFRGDLITILMFVRARYSIGGRSSGVWHLGLEEGIRELRRFLHHASYIITLTIPWLIITCFRPNLLHPHVSLRTISLISSALPFVCLARVGGITGSAYNNNHVREQHIWLQSLPVFCTLPYTEGWRWVSLKFEMQMGQISPRSSVRGPRDISVNVEVCPVLHLFVNYLKSIETVIQAKKIR